MRTVICVAINAQAQTQVYDFDYDFIQKNNNYFVENKLQF